MQKPTPFPEESKDLRTKSLFRGRTAYSNSLKPHPQTFAELAAALADPARMEETAETYHSLPKDDRAKLKDGPHYCCCSFSEPTRSDNNSDRIELIALDIDNGTFARIISPEHMEDLDMFGGFPFSWVLHSTTSSTEDAPRRRVLIDADGFMDTIHYQSCVMTVAKLLGMPLDEISTESRVISQPMYLPRLPSDALYVYGSRTDGRPFTFEDIDQTITVPTRTSRSKSTSSPADPDDIADGLEHLVPPVEEEESLIIDALYQIPPGCSRDQWVKICCGLKHQFQNDPERGFEIFHDWSTGGSNYGGEENTRRQWDYEESNPMDRTPATIRTVFHYAMENGWDRNTRAVSQYDDIRGEYSDLTPDQLLNEKTKELREGDYSHIERGLRIAAIQKRLKDCGVVVALTDLRRQTKPTRKPSDYAWFKNWIFVEAGKPYFLDSQHMASSKTVKDFNDAYRHRCPIEADGKRMTPYDAALTVAEVTTVEREIYHPGRTAGLCRAEGARVYNTYIPPSLEPSTDSEALADAKRLLTQMVKNTTGDEKERAMVWDFLAHFIQHPQRRINWTLTFQGLEGTGKTMIYDLLECLNTPHNSRKIPGEDFLKEWNDNYMGRCTLLCIDEIRVPSKSKYAVIDKFKSSVGNRTSTRHERFRSAQTVENHMTVIMTTNYKDAIPVTETDRRHAIVFSPITLEELRSPTLKTFHKEFHTRLHELAPAFLHVLKSHVISPTFDPFGHAPTTSSKERMIKASECSTVSMIRDLIADDAYPLITPDALSRKVLADTLAQVADRGTTRSAVTKALLEIGFESYRRHTHNGEKHPIWVHTRYRKCPIKRLRAGFNAHGEL